MNHLDSFDCFNINIIKNKFKNISEASESQDQEYRDKAENAYSWVCNALANGDYKREGDAFIMQGKDVSDDYSDLLIAFVHPSHRWLSASLSNPDSKVNYAYGRKGYQKIIICSNLIKPGDSTYIETRLNKSAFVHEFIHYLDAKPNRLKGSDVRSSAQEDTIAGYYNHPLEFNAYYQEVALTIDNMLKNEVLRNKFMDNFETFKKLCFSAMNKGFIKNVNAKYKVKLTKRFYNLYIGLVAKYSE